MASPPAFAAQAPSSMASKVEPNRNARYDPGQAAHHRDAHHQGQLV